MTGRGKFADHQRGEDFAGVRMTVLGDGVGVIKKLCLHFLLFVLNSFSQFRDELWCLKNILLIISILWWSLRHKCALRIEEAGLCQYSF